VLTITYDKLLELYFQNPEFGYYFLRLTTERLMQNIARLEGRSSRTRRPSSNRWPATRGGSAIDGSAMPARQRYEAHAERATERILYSCYAAVVLDEAVDHIVSHAENGFFFGAHGRVLLDHGEAAGARIGAV